MKKVFMSLAVVAAMFAAASCACCNNNSEAAQEAAAPAETECCGDCQCADSTQCEACDTTATDCAQAE